MKNDVEPRAPSTCKMRVASKNGGVDGETDVDSNRKCVKTGEKQYSLMLIDTFLGCRRAVDDPHKNMG